MIWLPDVEHRHREWTFIRLDSAGVIVDVYMSAKYPAVFDAAAFIGLHFSDVLLPPDADKFDSLMSRLIIDGDPVQTGYNVVFNGRVEYRLGIITKSGNEYWLYQWVGE